MKFLLVAVNAKYIHSNPAIYSLRAYAGEYRSHVELAEYTINALPEIIVKDIYKKKPNVIGFSCYIWNIEMVRSLIETIHKIMPDIPIWLGGPEVSFDCTETILNMPQIKGIMYGEGERIFSRLLLHYLEGLALEQIRGLVFRKNEKEIVINEPELILDLTTVPFLYEDSRRWENRIIYYETSRGCPFRCSYCLSSVDKQVRFRDIEVVKRELNLFLEQRVPQVKFVDRTFNAKKSHGLAIWNYLLEHDNGATNFHFEITADRIGREELDVLQQMRPGLIQLEIGVQTTNPKTAEAICREASFEKISETVAVINGFHNIHQHLDLIAGLPYEDYESFGRSFNDVYALRPEQLQLGFLKVLKGSPIEQQAEEYGICYNSHAPYEVLYTRWLSFDDVIRLKGIEEVVEVYYNSGQFPEIMKYLETRFSTPFSMYEALADYYECNHLFEVKHNRMARYEILRQFALSADGQAEEVYNSLLVYDCYLREKVKTRPAFAPDRMPYKEVIRNFYQKEAGEWRYLHGYEAYNSRQLEHMTQLEIFDIDIELLLEKGIVEKRRTAVLFDYQNKDPLSKNARTIILQLFKIIRGKEEIYEKYRSEKSDKSIGVDG